MRIFFGLIFICLLSEAALALPLKSTLPLKIAVVDVQKVLNKAGAGEEAREQLKNEMQTNRSLLQTEQSELEKMKSDAQKQAGVLSEAALQKKIEQIQIKEKELRRKLQDTKDELTIKNNAAVSKLMIKVKEVIDQVSAEDKIDVVLEKSLNTVVYNAESIDITEKVIDKLDR